MRLVKIAIGAFAALVAGTALALAGEDTGIVQKVEWGLGTVSLDNGHVYIIPPFLQSQVLVRQGDKVKITFTNRVAESITKLTS